MAQLVEQRIRNAWVTSSSLVIGSTLTLRPMVTSFSPEGSTSFAVESRYRLLKGTRLSTGSFFNAVIAQLVEQRLPKPQVAGPSPVYRSNITLTLTSNLSPYYFTKSTKSPASFDANQEKATVCAHSLIFSCRK